MRPTKECPECEGTGELEEFDRWDRSGMGGMSPIYREMRCDVCHGTGEIEHDDLCDCDECYVDEDAEEDALETVKPLLHFMSFFEEAR